MKVLGRKMIVCKQAVKWWDQELRVAIDERREVHRKYLRKEASFAEYAEKRKTVRDLVRKKKHGLWEEVVENVNRDFEGGAKQMWQGVNRLVKKNVGGAGNGIAVLRSSDGKMVSSSRGKRAVLAEHYQKLGTPTDNVSFDPVFKREVDEFVDKKVQEGREELGPESLKRKFSKEEVEKGVAKLKGAKAAGTDEVVNEILKFGGKGMIDMIVTLFNWVWENEYAPSRWREGVVVNILKKGDKAKPGIYRGNTLLNTIGKLYCKLLNDRIVSMLEKEGKISEGQAGFRQKRSCVDHVYTLNRIVRERKKAGLPTYCFFSGCAESV